MQMIKQYSGVWQLNTGDGEYLGKLERTGGGRYLFKADEDYPYNYEELQEIIACMEDLQGESQTTPTRRANAPCGASGHETG